MAESENDEESEAFYAEAATDALDALRKALEERQLAQALNGPFDACACRLEVQAGAGGLDAQDWTAMVARMYARFCDARGLQCRELERAEGDHPGCVKSVTLQVEGPHAFGLLRGERGAHRLVRQSPFNSAAKRQTSFASVEPVPELPDATLASGLASSLARSEAPGRRSGRARARARARVRAASRT